MSVTLATSFGRAARVGSNAGGVRYVLGSATGSGTAKFETIVGKILFIFNYSLIFLDFGNRGLIFFVLIFVAFLLLVLIINFSGFKVPLLFFFFLFFNEMFEFLVKIMPMLITAMIFIKKLYEIPRLLVFCLSQNCDLAAL